MGIGNARASARRSPSPVTSASARPAEASARKAWLAVPAVRNGGHVANHDGLAPRQVVGQQIVAFVLAQPEFRVRQYADELGGGLVACERPDGPRCHVARSQDVEPVGNTSAETSTLVSRTRRGRVIQPGGPRRPPRPRRPRSGRGRPAWRVARGRLCGLIGTIERDGWLDAGEDARQPPGEEGTRTTGKARQTEAKAGSCPGRSAKGRIIRVFRRICGVEDKE